jgi:hypothetical protein
MSDNHHDHSRATIATCRPGRGARSGAYSTVASGPKQDPPGHEARLLALQARVQAELDGRSGVNVRDAHGDRQAWTRSRAALEVEADQSVRSFELAARKRLRDERRANGFCVYCGADCSEGDTAAVIHTRCRRCRVLESKRQRRRRRSKRNQEA